MTSTRLKRVGFSVVLAIIVVGVIEALCRHQFAKHVERINDPDHRMAPHVNGNNGDGLRMEKEAAAFEEEDLNILFLGDSFVYGQDVEGEASFPQQFELIARAWHPDCDVNVANFGWSTSTPYLSARLLRDLGAGYAPDVVFLGVDMTDFNDDMRYRCLIERPTLVYKLMDYVPGIVILAKKTLVRIPFAWAEKVHVRLFRFPADNFYIVNRPLIESERFTESIQESIDDIAAYTRDVLKARFVLMLFPRSFQYSVEECPNNWEADQYEVLGPHVHEPFVWLDKLGARSDYPVHSLLEAFQNSDRFPTVFDDDPHWTELGHQVVADEVYRISRESGLFACD